MDYGDKAHTSNGPIVLRPQQDTLKPVSDDPDYKGLFVVTTYRAFFELLRGVQRKRDPERSGSLS